MGGRAAAKRVPLRAGTLLLTALLTAAVGGGDAYGTRCRENPSSIIDDISGLGPCRKCADDRSGRCEACSELFGLNKAGQCRRCVDENCTACRDGDPAFCTKCVANWEETSNPGLYATNGGNCAKCSADCLSCHNTNGTCYECERGTGLLEDGTCVPCSSDKEKCEACTGRIGNICTKCVSGWAPDADGRCSIKCPKGCDRCTSPTDCVGCLTYGQGWDAAKKKCVECRGDGCTDCDVADTCTACNGFFHFDAATSSCVPCEDQFCSSCDGSPSNCTRCSSDTDLTSTPHGVDLATGTCVECRIEGCSMCDLDADRCWACATGRLLEDARGPCTPCKVASCADCTFELDFQKGKSGDERCNACVEGYTLSEGATVCAKDVPPPPAGT